MYSTREVAQLGVELDFGVQVGLTIYVFTGRGFIEFDSFGLLLPPPFQHTRRAHGVKSEPRSRLCRTREGVLLVTFDEVSRMRV